MHRIAWRTPYPRRHAARRGTVALIAGVALLTMAAAAIAAHPKGGSHFAGASSVPPVNGFSAPVTFTVSHDGKSLTSFKYSSFGCLGFGGFRPGIDYYTQPGSVLKVGTVKVSASGHFSATGAVSVFSSHGNTITTTTSVSGAFTSPKAAKGSISLSQQETGKFKLACGPTRIGFTAKGH